MALISYFHLQVAWTQMLWDAKTTSITQEKDFKNIHLHTGYCKGFALQFQGLSCSSLFYCTSPLFYSIPASLVVLSKRQANPILAVFLFYIPLAQYIHLPSSWWSSDLLQQQLLFTACIKTENTKDSISKHKGSEKSIFASNLQILCIKVHATYLAVLLCSCFSCIFQNPFQIFTHK